VGEAISNGADRLLQPSPIFYVEPILHTALSAGFAMTGERTRHCEACRQRSPCLVGMLAPRASAEAISLSVGIASAVHKCGPLFTISDLHSPQASQ